ncbi:MAG: hypothetical protein WCG31_06395 [Deltaproteobacteria bacterium]
MIAYLDEIIKSPNPETDQVNLERYRAELQLWVEENKKLHSWNLEGFKSVISAGQNALKTAFLMNGGATVAMLAFVGKLSDDHVSKIPVFSSAMVCFVIGVLLVTVSSGCTYLSQWFYFKPEKWQNKAGFWLNMATIGCGLGSYGFFIAGVMKSYSAFIAFP